MGLSVPENYCHKPALGKWQHRSSSEVLHVRDINGGFTWPGASQPSVEPKAVEVLMVSSPESGVAGEPVMAMVELLHHTAVAYDFAGGQNAAGAPDQAGLWKDI